MYLVGEAHPLKTDAQLLLERAATAGERLVTDAEMLQEIVHRYTAIKRREAIDRAFHVVLRIVDEVYPIEKRDVLRAAEIVQGASQLSARDALHVAIMERFGIRRIISFDSDFDRWPGLIRLHRVNSAG